VQWSKKNKTAINIISGEHIRAYNGFLKKKRLNSLQLAARHAEKGASVLGRKEGCFCYAPLVEICSISRLLSRGSTHME
jgi:hypothetical protein